MVDSGQVNLKSSLLSLKVSGQFVQEFQRTWAFV